MMRKLLDARPFEGGLPLSYTYFMHKDSIGLVLILNLLGQCDSSAGKGSCLQPEVLGLVPGSQCA